jgi:hypothetical protein
VEQHAYNSNVFLQELSFSATKSAKDRRMLTVVVDKMSGRRTRWKK